MRIRLAKQSDKSKILEFSKNTFSWGDYIEEAWDHWIREGNLFIIENDFPLGLAHAHLSNDQVWIEGIRIHPQYRRKHYASKLIEKIENIAREKGKLFSFMLTDISNKHSILLAKKHGYRIEQTWNFYTIEPKICNSSFIEFTDIVPDYITHYVKSWRWLPFNPMKTEFSKQNKIIISNKNKNPSYAILMDSSRFGKTLVVTFFSGNNSNTANLLCYLQNFSLSKHYNRIEILTKETLPDFDSLNLKNSFHLFKKKLD